MAKENDLITSKLKKLYDSIQDEDIPEKFLDILDRLDMAEQKMKQGKGGEATHD